MFALGDDEKATHRKEMNAYVCCKSFFVAKSDALYDIWVSGCNITSVKRYASFSPLLLHIFDVH